MAEEELVEPFEEKELVGGCFLSQYGIECVPTCPIWKTPLKEIEALLDPEFVPEGWLDPSTPPKKKVKLSLAKKKT